MDRPRRRPPMEGFTRPGKGGEAWDDSVEGHAMNDTRDDQNQDDTEGHGARSKLQATGDDDDTEGHQFRNLTR